MSRRPRRVFELILLLLFAAVAVPACTSDEEGEPSANGSPSATANGLADSGVPQASENGADRSGSRRPLIRRRRRPATAPAQEPQAQPLEMPQVVLTQAHRDTCLVTTGDAMPQALLRDSQGEPVPLLDHFGEKLTVVLFWSGANIYSVEALQVLAAEVGEPFAEQGVSLVAVNVGETAEAASEHLDQAGAEIHPLFDSDKSFMSQVASEGLPRIYLLDHEGTILWFDIEYSPSTLRQLLLGIRFVLAPEGAGGQTGGEAESETGV